jgi:5'-nucleotidase
VRILVTNDDGVESPGIHALAGVLVDDGHDVLVVAPSDDRSGASASIGRLHRSGALSFARHDWPGRPDHPMYALDAPPATAVYAACLGAFGDRPDLVASGINPGANTGHLVLHSGTVGAALTAAVLGVPALAVSIGWAEEHHWETAATYAAAAIEWVAKPDGSPRVLNLNVPNVAPGDVLGIREGRLAPHGEVWVASGDVETGDLRLEYKSREDGAPDTDLFLVRSGYVSVTPLLGIERAAVDGAAEAIAAALER